MEQRAEEFVNMKASDLNGLAPSKEQVVKWLTEFAKNEVKAINYTRCSEQLKGKYGKDFEYFVTKQVNVRNVGNIYWFKGVGYTDLDELYKKWLKITKPLIV